MDETEGGRPERPDIERLLPRYRLQRQLSRTAMSEVFLARDVVLDVDVALKVIGPRLMRHPAYVARFDREAKIAVELHHPNIVEVYAAGRVGKGQRQLGFLAMRFVEGANLDRIIAEHGGLGLAETVKIARQLAAALDTAHAAGVVHRDVKPANVLVEKSTGRYYLCDFGVAKSATANTLTATGAAVGTAMYWAPEQQEDGRAVDRQADVYSLGCVLYDCLTGSPPAARAHRAVEVRSDAVERVLRKAMAHDPGQRQASCGALADDLARAARRTRWRPRLPDSGARPLVMRSVAALVLVAAVLTPWPQHADVDVSGLPAAVGGDCQRATPWLSTATSAVSCVDAAGRRVDTAVFASGRAATAAYFEAVDRAAVSTVSGDCVGGAAGEHRYPATGKARGRVLCYTSGKVATRFWLDHAHRAVSRLEGSDGKALSASWSALTDAEPAFPTREETRLAGVAAGTDCRRASPVELERANDAVAAVRCSPNGTGLTALTYYQFASVADVRSWAAGRVKSLRAPHGGV